MTHLRHLLPLRKKCKAQKIMLALLLVIGPSTYAAECDVSAWKGFNTGNKADRFSGGGHAYRCFRA